MTTEELKVALSSPLALFILMLLASMTSAWKQIRDGRKNGSTITWGDYFRHAPETLTVLVGNTIFFAGLVYIDQLNFASAIGIGYGVNSMADLVRSGGRSLSVAGSETVEEKQ